MFRTIVAAASATTLGVFAVAFQCLSFPFGFSLFSTMSLLLSRYICHDRWAAIRLNRFQAIRKLYQHMAIYRLIHRIDRAVEALPEPIDASDAHPDAVAALDSILSSKDSPDTFQKKETNRTQIESLVRRVCDLVEEVESGDYGTSCSPLILDVGAGKALFTRAVYETLDRRVPCVAFDRRQHHKDDQFYDPKDTDVENDQPYTRLVGDVGRLSGKHTLDALEGARGGGVVVVTKHLCGGATDNSLMALCRRPLSEYVGSACLAPCCHQKTRRSQYCNLKYLQSLGFCKTHSGKGGRSNDNDFVRVFSEYNLICKYFREKGSRNTHVLFFVIHLVTLLYYFFD